MTTTPDLPRSTTEVDEFGAAEDEVLTDEPDEEEDAERPVFDRGIRLFPAQVRPPLADRRRASRHRHPVPHFHRARARLGRRLRALHQPGAGDRGRQRRRGRRQQPLLDQQLGVEQLQPVGLSVGLPAHARPGHRGSGASTTPSSSWSRSSRSSGSSRACTGSSRPAPGAGPRR